MNDQATGYQDPQAGSGQGQDQSAQNQQTAQNQPQFQQVFSEDNKGDSGFSYTVPMATGAGQAPAMQPPVQQPQPVQTMQQPPVQNPVMQAPPAMQPPVQQPQPVQTMQQPPVQNPVMQAPPAMQPPVQQPQPVQTMQQPPVQNPVMQAPPAMQPDLMNGGGMMGDDDATAGGAQSEEDNTPANYQLGQYIKNIDKVPVPAHGLSFNESAFMTLLAGSISLSKDEKLRIIESIPNLRQQQIDQLVEIFEEEKRKFAELSAKHIPQLEKLAKQHASDWDAIVESFTSVERKQADDAQAEEIRRQLGL